MSHAITLATGNRTGRNITQLHGVSHCSTVNKRNMAQNLPPKTGFRAPVCKAAVKLYFQTQIPSSVSLFLPEMIIPSFRHAAITVMTIYIGAAKEGQVMDHQSIVNSTVVTLGKINWFLP